MRSLVITDMNVGSFTTFPDDLLVYYFLIAFSLTARAQLPVLSRFLNPQQKFPISAYPPPPPPIPFISLSDSFLDSHNLFHLQRRCFVPRLLSLCVCVCVSDRERRDTGKVLQMSGFPARPPPPTPPPPQL